MQHLAAAIVTTATIASTSIRTTGIAAPHDTSRASALEPAQVSTAAACSTSRSAAVATVHATIATIASTAACRDQLRCAAARSANELRVLVPIRWQCCH